MKKLILARHGIAASNVEAVVSSVPPGSGLAPAGVEEARMLGLTLRGDAIDLGVSSRLLRSQETLAVALADRDVATVVEPLFDEIRFGAFEGGPLADYRVWAWSAGPSAECPGGGESRVDAALRTVEVLERLLRRPEETIMAVGHALLIRYILDAAAGKAPAARVAPVPHATPFRLDGNALTLAGETLQAWVREPRFVEAALSG